MNVKYKETSEIGGDEPNSSKMSRGPSKHVLEDSMDNTSISKHLKKKEIREFSIFVRTTDHADKNRQENRVPKKDERITHKSILTTKHP